MGLKLSLPPFFHGFADLHSAKLPALAFWLGVCLSNPTSGADTFDDLNVDLDAVPQAAGGFEVSMFAREPLLHNPGALAFDAKGRLFVGQGPQFRHPEEDTPGDSILILVDTDGDGIADQSKTFAYGFNNIQSLAWKGSDLWIANAPDLSIVRDRDGDDVADEYVLVFSGVGTLEHGLHGLNWAPDGKLYMSKGDTPVQAEAPKTFRNLTHVASSQPDNQPIRVFGPPDAEKQPYRKTYIIPTDPHTEGGVLRCDEMGTNLEIFSRGNRNPFDIEPDDEFNWLGTDNDQEGGDKIFMSFYGAHFGHRHPWTYQWTGDDHPPTVPASGPFFHGSGVGVVYYTGSQFPPEYRNAFFIGDWLGKKVFVFRPAWNGALLSASEETLQEIVATGDEKSLFRPTGLAAGPDGALYVAGWGREYGATWDEDGNQTNEGRVFKIWNRERPLISENEWNPQKRKKPIAEWSLQDLLDDLDQDLPVWQVNAQDELVGRGSGVKKELIKALFSKNLSKKQRTWTAWALGRIETDRPDIDGFFTELLNREGLPLDLEIQSLRILAHRIRNFQTKEALPLSVTEMLSDQNPRLRFEAVQAIWQANQTERAESLKTALANETDPVVFYSLWGALHDLLDLEERKSLLSDSNPNVRLGGLLGLLAKNELDGEEVVRLLEADDDPQVQRWASTWMANVGHGLDDPSQIIEKLLEINQRGINYELRMNLLEALVKMNVAGEDWRRFYDGFYYDHTDGEIYVPEKSQEVALALRVMSDDERVLPILWDDLDHEWDPVRKAAEQCFKEVGEKGKTFLFQRLPEAEEEQLAGAVRSLDRFNFEKSPWAASLEHIESLARAYHDFKQEPVLRERILNLLIAVDADAWTSEKSKQKALEVAREASSDQDPRVHRLAPILGERLGETITVTVQREPTTPASVLTILSEASSQRGRELFFKEGGVASCYQCHQVDGEGKPFAPDLSDIATRSDVNKILESILDPNAAITEGFHAELIEIDDEDVYTGVVIRETDNELVVVESDGEETPLDKADIQNRRVLKTSVMPSNYSELLSREEAADLLAWLLTKKSKAAALP